MQSDELKTNTYNRVLILLMSLTACYGAVLIGLFPSFHTDDFLVFSYIEAHKAIPVAVDPSADFYLFFRPLSYLFFWIDYQIFGANAVLMKMFGFLIFLSLTYVVFKILSLINEEYKLNAHPVLLAFTTFFFVSHPDMLHCIVWISNANELLMISLYVLAVFVFLKTKMRTALSVALVIFLSLLSVLAKQQSLHFILLAGLFLLQTAGKENKDASRKAKVIIIVGLLVIAVYIAVSGALMQTESNAISYLWKKPFAVLGTVIYILIPIGGEKTYQFFIVHKGAAVVAGVLGFGAAAVCYVRSKHRKKILWFLIMSLVVFFPRMLAHGGDRVNSVQVFWLCVIVFIILARFHSNKLLLAGFFVLLGLNIVTSALFEYNYIASNQFQEKTDGEINAITRGRESDYLILIAGDTYLLDYSTHFAAVKKFGKTGYKVAPFMVNNMLETSNNREGIETVRCELCNDEIRISTALPHAYLSVDKTNPLSGSITILETRDSDVGRGFSYIRCTLPRKESSLQKIYFDGRQWKRL
jgi:hypothetical protein